jgi:hypothetical protein
MGIDNVKGPPGGTDPSKAGQKKDKVKGDEFKEYMKVDEVDQTDAEQRRKSKQRAEEVEKGEAEAAAEAAHTLSTPTTPFSLEPKASREDGPASFQTSNRAMRREPPPSTSNLPTPDRLPSREAASPLQPSSIEQSRQREAAVPPQQVREPTAASPREPTRTETPITRPYTPPRQVEASRPTAPTSPTIRPPEMRQVETRQVEQRAPVTPREPTRIERTETRAPERQAFEPTRMEQPRVDPGIPVRPAPAPRMVSSPPPRAPEPRAIEPTRIEPRAENRLEPRQPPTRSEKQESSSRSTQSERSNQPEKKEGTKEKSATESQEGEGDLIEQKRAAEKKGAFLPESPPVLEETEGYFKTFQAQNELSLSEEEQAEITDANPQKLSPPTAPLHSPLHTPPAEESTTAPAISGVTPSATPAAAPTQPVTETPPPTYTQLSPQVLALFERMVGVITVMQMTPGVTETAINLSSKDFASSIFYGTKIIITQDKSAQNQFNITINAPPQAAELLQANASSLRLSFEKAGYNFEIKQITVNIAEESEGEFKRKGSVGDEQMGT